MSVKKKYQKLFSLIAKNGDYLVICLTSALPFAVYEGKRWIKEKYGKDVKNIKHIPKSAIKSSLNKQPCEQKTG
jgi:hypothetical protein